MRLVRLELRNYRRHRDTRIEFPDGVTALLGPNGAGKSSILEAVSFALFGTSAARTGKDLIRSADAAPGDPVTVALELEVAGQAWSIVRELRGKNLTPTASLEVDGVPLVTGGAGSADAVTAEVEKRFGMDRDAFFTTVVARQKELSRLADQAPAERRRLLLEMLGVDAVDRAVARAREERRAVEERIAALRAVLPDPAVLEALLRDAEARHRERQAASVVVLEAWQAAQKSLAAVCAARDETERMESARREAERAATEAERQLAQSRSLLAALEARRADAARAADSAAALGDARSAADAARKALEEADRARQARDRHAEARKAMEAQERVVRGLRDAEAPRPGPVPDLASAANALSAAEGVLRTAQEASARAAARRDHLKSRLGDLGRLGADAPCPTCERPLAGHLENLVAHTQGTLAGLEREATAAESEAKTAAARRTEAAQARDEAMRLEREHHRIAATRTTWEARLRDAEAHLAVLKTAVPSEPAPVPDLAPLAAALRAAEKRHDEATRLRALSEEVPRLAAEAKALADAVRTAEATAKAARGRWAVLPVPQPSLAEREKELQKTQEKERTAERSVHAAATEERVAAEAAATARARLAEAARQRERLAAEESELLAWNQLVGARGGGLLERFREHLTRRIAPAVSREASALLSRFTDGRYTEIVLDGDFGLYVGDGGVHYTLDRFSGGESDLVHLALRLAVSRLLASRGGAEMRFLALDEVFGSLDRERRGLVLGALRALEGIYSQVLLVTHLDEMEDALDQSLRVVDDGGRAVVTAHKG